MLSPSSEIQRDMSEYWQQSKKPISPPKARQQLQSQSSEWVSELKVERTTLQMGRSYTNCLLNENIHFHFPSFQNKQILSLSSKRGKLTESKTLKGRRFNVQSISFWVLFNFKSNIWQITKIFSHSVPITLKCTQTNTITINNPTKQNLQ